MSASGRQPRAAYSSLVIRKHAILLLGVLAACTVEYGADDHWADQRDIPPIGNGKLLVTNSGDDTLSWIDLDSLEVVFKEPVGRIVAEREGPHHAAAMPDGSAYFVGISNFVPGAGSGPHGTHGTGTVPGYLMKFDTETHEVLGEVQVDRSPGDVRITPDGRFVVQSHFDLLKIQEALQAGGTLEDMNATVAIMRTDPFELVEKVEVCPAAHGLAADDDFVYVACWGSDELAIISLADFSVERFPVGAGAPDPTAPNYEPYGIAIAPGGDEVWVSCLRTGDLRVFDTATKTFDPDPISMGGGAPFFGDFLDDGSRFYVAVQGANRLGVVDTTTRAVTMIDLPFPEVCEAPHAVLVLPGEERALVVCEGNHVDPGAIAVVNIAAGGVEDAVEVGVYPDDVVLIQ